jgi:hypothetical protein
MSARLLCELLYDNDDLKELFVQMMNIVPSHGNVTLSRRRLFSISFPKEWGFGLIASSVYH